MTGASQGWTDAGAGERDDVAPDQDAGSLRAALAHVADQHVVTVRELDADLR